MDLHKFFVDLYHKVYGPSLCPSFAEDLVTSFQPYGKKWTKDEAVILGNSININWNEVPQCDFFVVLNMVYSECYETINQYNLPDKIYAELAFNWIQDKNGGQNKTVNYFLNL